MSKKALTLHPQDLVRDTDFLHRVATQANLDKILSEAQPSQLLLLTKLIASVVFLLLDVPDALLQRLRKSPNRAELRRALPTRTFLRRHKNNTSVLKHIVLQYKDFISDIVHLFLQWQNE